MSRILMIVFAGAALASCGHSSGIVPIGQDTYMLSAPGGFFTLSGGSVKANLYRKANAYCGDRHRLLMPVTEKSHNSGVAKFAGAEIQFRCLPEGDPALASTLPRQLPEAPSDDAAAAAAVAIMGQGLQNAGRAYQPAPAPTSSFCYPVGRGFTCQ